MTPVNKCLLEKEKTCKRGHKYVSSGKGCKHCRNQRIKRWKLQNLEKVKEQRKRYNAKTKDHYAPLRRAYRQAHPEWDIWYGMILRCNDPKNPRYGDYGGRGIKVCERWLKFENFFLTWEKGRARIIRLTEKTMMMGTTLQTANGPLQKNKAAIGEEPRS